ncbi:MAG: aspartate/glutamate racemase family protein [Tepidanaerobacteraceae bacterium]|jgi:hypothetical protein|nr:aspartate/glutamate racemase family protein [Thermoanaerobacterales bacterium]
MNTNRYPYYGKAMGILLNNTTYPLIPGNVGNATTYPFPVEIKSIKEFPTDWHCDKRGADGERLEYFVRAAKGLESEGIKAITTGCGFYALFQKRATPYLKVPLFSSPLLMVPLVYNLVGKKGKIGILTASSRNLSEAHFDACNISSSIPIVIQGMDEYPEFQDVIMKESKSIMDIEVMKNEVVDAAKKLVNNNEDVSALVFECSDMPPFAKAVYEAVNIPVFDFINMIKFANEMVITKD